MIKIYKDYNIGNKSYSHLKALVKYYIETDEINLIQYLIKHYNNYYFVGNMSKLLFAFEKKDIILIRYMKEEIVFLDDIFIASSGISLFKLGKILIKKGIEGFEKIMTIPGFLGGSVFNNVSFLNQEISNYILYLIIINENGEIKIIPKEDIIFSYRKMEILKEKRFFILKIIFKRINNLRYLLYKNYNESIKYRLNNQEKFLSLGSTFKNYKNYKAYLIIREILPYLKIEKNLLSEKHLNFIKIKPDSTNIKLVKLIERMQKIIYNKFDFYLESEIKIIY